MDRYGEWLVLQALSQGTDRLLPMIVQLLVDIAGPAGILARNDPRVRQLEGLEQKVEVLQGSVPERIGITESGILFDVDPWHGQSSVMFSALYATVQRMCVQIASTAATMSSRTRAMTIGFV